MLTLEADRVASDAMVMPEAEGATLNYMLMLEADRVASHGMLITEADGAVFNTVLMPAADGVASHAMLMPKAGKDIIALPSDSSGTSLLHHLLPTNLAYVCFPAPL